MKKLISIFILLFSCTSNIEQIDEEEEMPTFVINHPSTSDSTIYGVMEKRDMLVDDWMYIKLNRGIVNDNHRQKYIDLGKEVYKNYFYDVFDPKIYTRDDSLFIDSILTIDPEEYFYIGYIYSRDHQPSCKTIQEDTLYESTMIINNQ